MRALKLDSSFRPIQIISSFDAFCMIYIGRANLVESYDNHFIRSAYEKFDMPCVIALNRYININKISLKCNRRNVFWRDSGKCQYCGNVFPESLLTLIMSHPEARADQRRGKTSLHVVKTVIKRKETSYHIKQI